MNNELSYLVSNIDLQKMYKGCKIILYSELYKINNLTDLIPNDESVCFILIKTTNNSGHWTVICRRLNHFYYFDSYGVIYDGELVHVQENLRFKLHEDKYYLSALIKNAEHQGYTITYNKYQFQTYSATINTCGKWCLTFAKFITNRNLDDSTIALFKSRILALGKKYNVPLDNLVCVLYDSFK